MGGDQQSGGSQINERSLRILGEDLRQGERAEAYLRFPAGPQNLLTYRTLRVWLRGRGAGWAEHDLQAFVKLGSDDDNFYLFRASARTDSWEPEAIIDLETWRRLRADLENRWLAGEPPSGAAECGTQNPAAYVACEGPYVVHLTDPGINPPNLASVQELSAGIYRVGSDRDRAARRAVGGRHPAERSGVADRHRDVARHQAGRLGRGQPECRLYPAEQPVPSDQPGPDLPGHRRAPDDGQSPARSVPPHLVRAGDAAHGEPRPPERGPGAAHRHRSPGRSAHRPSQAGVLEHHLRLDAPAKSPGHQLGHKGLLDPLAFTGAYTRGRAQTELSDASSSTYALGLDLPAQPASARLPAAARRARGSSCRGRRESRSVARTSAWCRRASASPAASTGTRPTRPRSSIPVARSDDRLLTPTVALNHLWRNSAGLTWQPIGMLNLNGDLTSTRDLRVYPDSTTIGRVAYNSRRFLLGMPVGVERDRNLSTALALTPTLTPGCGPGSSPAAASSSAGPFSSRDPVRADGDSGAFILPQTMNNSRTNEIGASLDLARGLRGLAGDSGGLGRALVRVRPVDVSTRITRTSTFDLDRVRPQPQVQLALGRLENYLEQEGAGARGRAPRPASRSSPAAPICRTGSPSRCPTR